MLRAGRYVIVNAALRYREGPPKAGTMIEFRTLGRLALRDPEGRDLLAVFSASKRVALLSYLALASPGGFHRRDTLVALLWR